MSKILCQFKIEEHCHWSPILSIQCPQSIYWIWNMKYVHAWMKCKWKSAPQHRDWDWHYLYVTCNVPKIDKCKCKFIKPQWNSKIWLHFPLLIELTFMQFNFCALFCIINGRFGPQWNDFAKLIYPKNLLNASAVRNNLNGCHPYNWAQGLSILCLCVWAFNFLAVFIVHCTLFEYDTARWFIGIANDFPFDLPQSNTNYSEFTICKALAWKCWCTVLFSNLKSIVAMMANSSSWQMLIQYF